MQLATSIANHESRRLTTKQLAAAASGLDKLARRIDAGELALVPGPSYAQGPLSQSGDTLAVGSPSALPAAGAPLRTSPLIDAGPPQIPGLSQEEQDIADIEYAEKECWKNLTWIKHNVKKPSAMAVSNILREIRGCKETKVRLRDQLYRKKEGIPPQWLELKDKIIEALRPYPEALKAVAEAIGTK